MSDSYFVHIYELLRIPTSFLNQIPTYSQPFLIIHQEFWEFYQRCIDFMLTHQYISGAEHSRLAKLIDSH